MSYVGERKSSKRTNRSWTLISFTFFINFSMGYAFTRDIFFFKSFFLFFTIFSGTVFVLLFLKNFISLRKNPIERKIAEIGIVKKYLKISRKYLMASAIGMVLATLLLSQGILTPQIYEKQIAEQYFNGNQVNSFSINYYHNTNNVTNDMPIIFENFKKMKTIAEQQLSGSNFPIVSAFDWITLETSLNSSRLIKNNSRNDFYYGPSFVTVLPLTENNIQFLSDRHLFQGSSTNDTAMLLTYPSFKEFFQSENTVPLLFEKVYSFEPTYNATKLEYSVNLTNKVFTSLYDLFDNYVGEILLFVSIPIFSDLMSIYQTQYPVSYNKEFSRSSYTLFLYSPIPPLDDIDSRKKELAALTNKLYGSFSEYDVYITTPFEKKLDDYQDTLSGLIFTIILFLSPIIGLGLYLVYYSSTLVEKRRRKLVSIMRMRGTTENELKTMFIFEIVAGSLIAVGVGMVLSIPWVQLINSFSGFFQISFNQTPSVSPIFEWYWQVPLTGMILAFDVNMFPLFKLADPNLTEGMGPEEKRPPFWQRYYFDVILFIIGFIDYALISFIPINPQTIGVLIIIFLLSPFAIIGIFIGSSLIVARFFSPVIGFFSDFIWIRRGDMIALATRNMRQNRYTSSKLVAFILFALMVSFTFIILPNSIIPYSEETTMYSSGADVVISGPQFLNTSTLTNITGIEGVEGFTNLVQTYLSFERSISLLAVNASSFAEYSFWKGKYADKPIEKLMDALGKKQENILMQKLSAKSLDIEVGDSFFLQSSDNTIDLTVVGMFDYFPRLVQYLDPTYPQTYFVMNLDYFFSLNLTGITAYSYIKVDKNANITRILSEIDDVLPASYSVSSPLKEISENNVFKKLTVTISQSSLMTALLAISIATFYYAFTTLSDRKKEIGIFRALGMKEKQIFQLLLVETLIIILIGVLLGIVFGVILSDFISKLIFAGSFGVPPFSLEFPISYLSSYGLIVLLLAVVGAIIPAKRIASLQTGSILRAE